MSSALDPRRRPVRAVASCAVASRAVATCAAVVALGGCSGWFGPDDAERRYTLRVEGSGTGGGVVTSLTSGPAEFSCSIDRGTATGMCVLTRDRGASVSLEATAIGGSTFSGWSGACGGDGSCVVEMTGDRTVTATFDAATLGDFVLTLAVSGQGSGTISSTPSAIGCTLVAGAVSGTCSAPFTPGTEVTLRASAVAGSTFGGWGGACTPSGVMPTCTIPMLQPQQVTASFVPAGAQ